MAVGACANHYDYYAVAVRSDHLQTLLKYYKCAENLHEMLLLLQAPNVCHYDKVIVWFYLYRPYFQALLRSADFG